MSHKKQNYPLRRSSRLSQYILSTPTTPTTSSTNKRRRAKSYAPKYSKKETPKTSKRTYTPKPPTNKSRRRRLSRKRRRNSSTYGKGDGSEQKPYVQNVKDASYQRRLDRLNKDYPKKKQIKKLTEKLEQKTNELNETKKELNDQQMITECLSHSLCEQEEILLSVINALNKYENENNGLWRRVEIRNDEINKLLNQLQKYRDIECDDEVWIDVEIVNGKKEKKEEFTLYGIQNGTLYKFRRYNAKIMIMCIDLRGKAKAEHIPIIITSVLEAYTDYDMSVVRVPCANTISDTRFTKNI